MFSGSTDRRYERLRQAEKRSTNVQSRAEILEESKKARQRRAEEIAMTQSAIVVQRAYRAHKERKESYARLKELFRFTWRRLMKRMKDALEVSIEKASANLASNIMDSAESSHAKPSGSPQQKKSRVAHLAPLHVDQSAKGNAKSVQDQPSTPLVLSKYSLENDSAHELDTLVLDEASTVFTAPTPSVSPKQEAGDDDTESIAPTTLSSNVSSEGHSSEEHKSIRLHMHPLNRSASGGSFAPSVAVSTALSSTPSKASSNLSNTSSVSGSGTAKSHAELTPAEDFRRLLDRAVSLVLLIHSRRGYSFVSTSEQRAFIKINKNKLSLQKDLPSESAKATNGQQKPNGTIPRKYPMLDEEDEMLVNVCLVIVQSVQVGYSAAGTNYFNGSLPLQHSSFVKQTMMAQESVSTARIQSSKDSYSKIPMLLKPFFHQPVVRWCVRTRKLLSLALSFIIQLAPYAATQLCLPPVKMVFSAMLSFIVISNDPSAWRLHSGVTAARILSDVPYSQAPLSGMSPDEKTKGIAEIYALHLTYIHADLVTKGAFYDQLHILLQTLLYPHLTLHYIPYVFNVDYIMSHPDLIPDVEDLATSSPAPNISTLISAAASLLRVGVGYACPFELPISHFHELYGENDTRQKHTGGKDGDNSRCFKVQSQKSDKQVLSFDPYPSSTSSSVIPVTVSSLKEHELILRLSLRLFVTRILTVPAASRIVQKHWLFPSEHSKLLSEAKSNSKNISTPSSAYLAWRRLLIAVISELFDDGGESEYSSCSSTLHSFTFVREKKSGRTFGPKGEFAFMSYPAFAPDAYAASMVRRIGTKAEESKDIFSSPTSPTTSITTSASASTTSSTSTSIRSSTSASLSSSIYGISAKYQQQKAVSRCKQLLMMPIRKKAMSLDDARGDPDGDFGVKAEDADFTSPPQLTFYAQTPPHSRPKSRWEVLPEKRYEGFRVVNFLLGNIVDIYVRMMSPVRMGIETLKLTAETFSSIMPLCDRRFLCGVGLQDETDTLSSSGGKSASPSSASHSFLSSKTAEDLVQQGIVEMDDGDDGDDDSDSGKTGNGGKRDSLSGGKPGKLNVKGRASTSSSSSSVSQSSLFGPRLGPVGKFTLEQLEQLFTRDALLPMVIRPMPHLWGVPIQCSTSADSKPLTQSTVIGNSLYTNIGSSTATALMKRLLFQDGQPPLSTTSFSLTATRAPDLLLIQLGYQRFLRISNEEMDVHADMNFFDDYGSTVFTFLLQILTQCLRPRFACTSMLLFSTPLLPCLVAWLEYQVGCPLIPAGIVSKSIVSFASSTRSTSSAPPSWLPKDPGSVITHWLEAFGVSVPVYTLVRQPLLQAADGVGMNPEGFVREWLRSVKQCDDENSNNNGNEQVVSTSNLVIPPKIPSYASILHLFAIMYGKLLFVLTEDELRTTFPPFGSVLPQRVFTKLLQIIVFELIAFESVFVPTYGATLSNRLPSVLVGLRPASPILQKLLKELYRRDVRLPFMVSLGTSPELSLASKPNNGKDKRSQSAITEDPNSLGPLLSSDPPSLFPFFAPQSAILPSKLTASPFSSLPFTMQAPWYESAKLATNAYEHRYSDNEFARAANSSNASGAFSRQGIVEEQGRAWLLNESWWSGIWTSWLDALTTRQRVGSADAPVTALAAMLTPLDRSLVLDVLGRLPFAVRFEQRVSLLRALVQLDKATLPTVTHPLTGRQEVIAHDIVIRRGHIMQDGLDAVTRLGRSFRGRVRVKFIDALTREEEKGVDVGGPFKEFLETVVSDAFSTGLGLFLETEGQDVLTYSEKKTNEVIATDDFVASLGGQGGHGYADEAKSEGLASGAQLAYRRLVQSEAKFRRVVGRSYYPNPAARVLPDNLALLQFIGRVVGKALYEGILLHVPLAPFFLCKVIGQPCVLSDLQLMNKKLYENLMVVKTYQGDIEDLFLTFSVDEEILGEYVARELKPNGHNIPVTNENRIEYIYAVADYHLNRATSAQARAFISGLSDVIDLGWLRMFNVLELQLLLSGSAETIDVDDWEEHTVWHTPDGSNPDSKLVKWFWQAVRSFSDDDRSSLLKFVTCCSRPPLGGFRHLTPPFTIRIVDVGIDPNEPKRGFFKRLFSKTADKSQLPSASTCFNILNLPRYSSKEVLFDKLKTAILATGFHLT